MKAILLLLLLLFAPPPPPTFTALWDSATSATVQWTQSARGCLSRESAIGERVFIGCYERVNVTIVVELGHAGPLSGELRPRSGDVYVLDQAALVRRAPLIGRPVYMAAWR